MGIISTSLLHLGQISTSRSTQLPLSIVGRPTNLRPPQTSFHMTSFFRRPNFHRYCDVSNVARETLQTWKDRRFKRGKTDNMDNFSTIWTILSITLQIKHRNFYNMYQCGMREGVQIIGISFMHYLIGTRIWTRDSNKVRIMEMNEVRDIF